MAKRNINGEVIAVNLSEDQNPNKPDEQARIEGAGGFVSPPPEPGLSARVWLDADFTQIGLAMARSIGDHAVSPVGGEKGYEERSDELEILIFIVVTRLY